MSLPFALAPPMELLIAVAPDVDLGDVHRDPESGATLWILLGLLYHRAFKREDAGVPHCDRLVGPYPFPPCRGGFLGGG